MREYSRNKKSDRSNWAPGPWNNEPEDFYEWTTAVGYPAYATRLSSGAWAGVIVAPYPTEGQMLLAFSHHMRDKYGQEHQAGMISKTDVEGVGEYSISMEHWESPGPAYGGRTWNRGPYKTLEYVKEVCEKKASEIFETLQKKEYVDYFTR